MKLSVAILCFGISVGTAYGETVDTYSYRVETTRVSDCNALAGITRFKYREVSSPARLAAYLLSEVCVSPDEGWLDGPEPARGFTKAEEFAPGSARYEIISDSEIAALRRNFYIGSMENTLPVFSSDTNIYSFYTSLKASADGPLPEADFVQGTGWIYNTALPVLSSLPEDRWLVYMHVAVDRRLALPPTGVNSDSLYPGALFTTVETGESATIITSNALTWTDIALDLSVSDGEASGTLSFKYFNATASEARESNEYSYAVFEFENLHGKALKIGSNGTLLGVGWGLAMAYDDDGRSRADPASIEFAAIQVPEGTHEEIISLMFRNNQQ